MTTLIQKNDHQLCPKFKELLSNSFPLTYFSYLDVKTNNTYLINYSCGMIFKLAQKISARNSFNSEELLPLHGDA